MRGRRLIFLLYFLSGAAGLLYQVVWLRLLTLSMGHTVGAVGIVLAAFMGGLAIGAWAGGRLAPHLTEARALKAYACLELTIAAFALLLPPVLSSFQPLLSWAYGNGDGARLFDVTRIALSLLLLSVPTAAMGATYPISVRSLAARAQSTAAGASGLYAVNTIGAAAGATLSGFILLPMLGLRATTLVGVTLNTLAALGAFWLARRWHWQSSDLSRRVRLQADGRLTAVAKAMAVRRPASAKGFGGPPKQCEGGSFTRRRKPAATDPYQPWATSTIGERSHIRLAAVALGISGFVALVYEVAWTRILAMVLGPTTYAFSAMLVAFITGLAIGSTGAAALLPRAQRVAVSPTRTGAWLAIAILTSAITALVSCWLIDRLPLTIAAAVGRPDVDFRSVFALQTVLVIAVQMPMTIALGAAFPFAIALAAPDPQESPRAVAGVYAANTAGAIAGAMATSVFLIPAVGLQNSVRAAAQLAILTGFVVWWRSVSGRAGRIAAALTAVAATTLAVFMPMWNHERLSNGAYRYAAALAAGDLETGLEAGHLLFYREGAAGTVSVRQLPGVTSLAIDGKVDASNGGDMLTQKLLAHLPLLLHANPQRVAVIGLGSGVTLGAALRHPIERADVLEISPEVVAASQFFAKENQHALADTRTRLIVGDGRSHLLLSTERYDVIISEPSNPWMAGVATLFTREFFAAARERLMPGGILCQWAHTYNLSDGDLRSIVATFLSAFPDGSAWLVGESDLLLIGGTEPAPVPPFNRLADEWDRPGVATDLAEVSVRNTFSLLTLFLASGADLQQYAAGAVVQSDDRLSLEYSAPRALYGRFQRPNVDRLRELAARAQRPESLSLMLAAAGAVQWRNRGAMYLQADAPELAYEDFRNAVTSAPRDGEALDGFARSAARAGRLDDAEIFLTDLAAKWRAAPVLVELSIVLSARGRVEEAAQTATQAVTLEPDNTLALEQLASVYADQGNEAALEHLARGLQHLMPGRTVTLYSEARLSYLRGDFERAAQLAQQLVAVNGANANALNLLGSANAALGRHDRARDAFQASLGVAPRDPAVLVNLGTTELRSANPAAAAERFSEALSLYPTMVPALDGLAQALEQQGQTRRANEIRQRIPGDK